jgi:hypothetical protein
LTSNWNQINSDITKKLSKRLPVSTFKDAVHLSPNDDYYLVTDSEGNIGNMRFFRPIPEPQVTEPELLQENMLTRIMHVDLRLQVGNFGDQHEFLDLQLSIFVPF